MTKAVFDRLYDGIRNLTIISTVLIVGLIAILL